MKIINNYHKFQDRTFILSFDQLEVSASSELALKISKSQYTVYFKFETPKCIQTSEKS